LKSSISAAVRVDREGSRSVPENTGRNGRYKTGLVGRGFVEAARFLGGQLFGIYLF